MTIQSALNNQCLNHLTLVKALIEKQPAFEKNQMIELTLRKCMNSLKPVSEMKAIENAKFQRDLINSFKIRGWTTICFPDFLKELKKEMKDSLNRVKND